MMFRFILTLLALAGAAALASAAPFNTVIVDAGHGGEDRGGIPTNLLPEKGVALDVARRVRAILADAGLRTVMTRSGDYFVPLAQRVAISNSYRNALFVSIHFNSGERVGARGVETYYGSQRAIPLASRIQRNMMSTTTGDDRGIKYGRFYVLKHNRNLSVLVECGFLTNPTDARLANSSSYRQKIAGKIAAAILSYRASL